MSGGAPMRHGERRDPKGGRRESPAAGASAAVAASRGKARAKAQTAERGKGGFAACVALARSKGGLIRGGEAERGRGGTQRSYLRLC